MIDSCILSIKLNGFHFSKYHFRIYLNLHTELEHYLKLENFVNFCQSRCTSTRQRRIFVRNLHFMFSWMRHHKLVCFCKTFWRSSLKLNGKDHFERKYSNSNAREGTWDFSPILRLADNANELSSSCLENVKPYLIIRAFCPSYCLLYRMCSLPIIIFRINQPVILKAIWVEGRKTEIALELEKFKTRSFV